MDLLAFFLEPFLDASSGSYLFGSFKNFYLAGMMFSFVFGIAFAVVALLFIPLHGNPRVAAISRFFSPEEWTRSKSAYFPYVLMLFLSWLGPLFTMTVLLSGIYRSEACVRAYHGFLFALHRVFLVIIFAALVIGLFMKFF